MVRLTLRRATPACCRVTSSRCRSASSEPRLTPGDGAGRRGMDMRKWLEALAVYREPPVLVILVLGFASGLPLALTGATLTFWVSEAGVDITLIGMLAWVGLAYSWKFLWSPAIDRLPI